MSRQVLEPAAQQPHPSSDASRPTNGASNNLPHVILTQKERFNVTRRLPVPQQTDQMEPVPAVLPPGYPGCTTSPRNQPLGSNDTLNGNKRQVFPPRSSPWALQNPSKQRSFLSRDPELRKTTSATDLTQGATSSSDQSFRTRRRVNSSRDDDGSPTWLRPFELTPTGSPTRTCAEEVLSSKEHVVAAVLPERPGAAASCTPATPRISPRNKLGLTDSLSKPFLLHYAPANASVHQTDRLLQANGPTLLSKRHGFVEMATFRLSSAAEQTALSVGEPHSLPSTPTRLPQADLDDHGASSSPRRASVTSDRPTTSSDSLSDLTEELADCTVENSVVKHARWTRITCESSRPCGGFARAFPSAASPREKQAFREAALIPRRSHEHLSSPLASPDRDAAMLLSQESSHEQSERCESRPASESSQCRMDNAVKAPSTTKSSAGTGTLRSSGSHAELARQRVRERARLRESLVGPRLVMARQRVESLQTGSSLHATHRSSSSRGTVFGDDFPETRTATPSDSSLADRATSSLDSAATSPIMPGTRYVTGSSVLPLAEAEPTLLKQILRTTKSSDAINPRAAAIAALTRNQDHGLGSIQPARSIPNLRQRRSVRRGVTSNAKVLPPSSLHGLEGAHQQLYSDENPTPPRPESALRPRETNSFRAAPAVLQTEQQVEHTRSSPHRRDLTAKEPLGNLSAEDVSCLDSMPSRRPSFTGQRGDVSHAHGHNHVGLGLLVEGVALGSPEQIKASKQEVRPGYFSRLRNKTSASQLSEAQGHSSSSPPVPRDDGPGRRFGPDRFATMEHAPRVSSLATSALGAASAMRPGIAFPGNQSTDSLAASTSSSAMIPLSLPAGGASPTASKARWWQRRRQSSKPAAPSQATETPTFSSPLSSATPPSLVAEPLRYEGGYRSDAPFAGDARGNEADTPALTSPSTSFLSRSLWGKPANRDRGPLLPAARPRHASFTSAASPGETRSSRTKPRMSINLSAASQRGQADPGPSSAKSTT